MWNSTFTALPWTGWVWGLLNSLERDLWLWVNFANTFSLLLPLVEQVIWIEWSQNRINYNLMPPMQWDSIFSSFVPIHIHAYSILGIFPGHESLPKLNWSNSCFQDLSEVSQKHPHLLAPERGWFGPVLISTKHLLIIVDQFQLLSISGCVTRAPLLYFVRSWVALSFKVCQWVCP